MEKSVLREHTMKGRERCGYNKINVISVMFRGEIVPVFCLACTGLIHGLAWLWLEQVVFRTS